MVAVLVVHFLLGLLLDFVLILHLGTLVAVLLAHYHRRLYKMVRIF